MTSITCHAVQSLEAHTVQGVACSPHITINFRAATHDGGGSITFFLDDAVLNERLIRAINEVVDFRKEEIAARKNAGGKLLESA